MRPLEGANRKEITTIAYRWDGVPLLVGCYDAMRPCIFPDGRWGYVDARDLVITGDDVDPTVWVSDSYYAKGR